MPPISPIKNAFNKKIARMSLFLAPSAFIIPISFVFSRTEVNIVLAMPTAPTRSATAAMAVKNVVNELTISDLIFSDIINFILVLDFNNN
jgi:hypothetical protein